MSLGRAFGPMRPPPPPATPFPVARASVDDHTACARIFLEARLCAFHWVDPLSLSLSDYFGSVVDEDVWVAREGGRVIGFASVYAASSFIHNLFVDPGRQGVGVGRSLVETVLAAYHGPMRLKCVADNLPARRFYRRLGWREESRGVEDGITYILFRSGH